VLIRVIRGKKNFPKQSVKIRAIRGKKNFEKHSVNFAKHCAPIPNPLQNPARDIFQSIQKNNTKKQFVLIRAIRGKKTSQNIALQNQSIVLKKNKEQTQKHFFSGKNKKHRRTTS